MNDCIFCKIANGNDTATLIWQNEVAAAINDINPKTPVHVLVMPKRHIKNIDELEDVELAGQLLLAAREVAHKVGLKGAWRVRVNNGREVGQTVDHLHFHVMGGKQLAED
jgi:histidine triad (HIT) family protein